LIFQHRLHEHAGFVEVSIKRRHGKNKVMLSWSLTFLVLAIIAGILGFGGIAGTAAGIAKILFIVFLVLLIVSAISRSMSGKNP